MTPPDKRETFLALLEKGWVSVCLDGRRDGVELPERFRTQARLILQYGLDMPVPIADLDASPEGIRATLSFDRVPQATFIPWHAVYVLAEDGGQGILYRDDVPPEFTAGLNGPDGETQGAERPPAPPAPEAGKATRRAAPRPPLSMVPPSEAGEPAPTRPGKRPTLRLVK